MDLLTGYGSGAESDASDDNAQGQAALTEGMKETSSKAGLFASLPPPNGGQRTADSFGLDSGSSLFSKLPAPKIAAVRPTGADLQTELGGLTGPPKLGSLPPPQKKVVQFRPPIDASILGKQDEDDSWQPPKKKVRTADVGDGGAVDKSDKPSFASFLPPPKNSLGAGNILGGGAAGGRKMAMDTAPEEERPRIQLDETTPSTNSAVTLTPSGLESAGLSGRVDERSSYPEAAYSADYTQPYASHSQTANGQPLVQAFDHNLGYQSSSNVYGQEYYQAGPNTWQAGGPPSGGQPVDLLTAKIMEEEARKSRRGGGHESGPQIVEVKQADITGGTYRREDMLKNSFGPKPQAMSSAKDAGPKKLEKRKHQISSLYADMKKKEMEMMDSRSAGMQTKAQTKGKYGW